MAAAGKSHELSNDTFDELINQVLKKLDSDGALVADKGRDAAMAVYEANTGKQRGYQIEIAKLFSEKAGEATELEGAALDEALTNAIASSAKLVLEDPALLKAAKEASGDDADEAVETMNAMSKYSVASVSAEEMAELRKAACTGVRADGKEALTLEQLAMFNIRTLAPLLASNCFN